MTKKHIFQEVLVDKEFKTLQEEITENRTIVIKHGGVLGDYVIKGPKKTGKIFLTTCTHCLHALVIVITIYSLRASKLTVEHE